jgi:hypothetical protein
MEIGVDEFGIAIAQLFMPHMNPETPIYELEGVWYMSGDPIDFTLTDDVASFHMQGMLFERRLGSE